MTVPVQLGSPERRTAEEYCGDNKPRSEFA